MANVPELDLARIHRYCAERVPADLLNRVRVEATTRGRTVTIVECRPPWREDIGGDWTRQPIAQLRYDDASKLWTLYWPDRNARWHVFDLIDPGSVSELLEEIELDRTSIFWG